MLPPSSWRRVPVAGQRVVLDGIIAHLREGGRLALIHLSAGGSSLLRVAGKEHLALDAVSIQLQNAPSARAVRVAVTNSMDVGASDLYVDNSGVITSSRWEPVPLPEPPSPGHYQGEGSVLVTGGLGGLGLSVAMVLTQFRSLRE